MARILLFLRQDTTFIIFADVWSLNVNLSRAFTYNHLQFNFKSGKILIDFAQKVILDKIQSLEIQKHLIPMMQGQKRIQKYQFSMKNLLGQGSYANVYMGKIIQTGEKVAVKVIDKRLFANSYNVKNIQSEIEIMKKVDHGNIVKLFDVYQTTNNMYIITELCEDGDFYNFLQKKRKVQEEEAKGFLKQIMKGIKYLHMNGIIHRDLKPANILMKNYECKISDFGFAKNLQHENSIMKSIVGTPLYMSPQLLKKVKYTNKSDLWSIGLIYYEMLHGRTPWPASNQLQLINGIYSKKPSFHSLVSSVSKDFILKCLQIQESKRMSWEDAFDHPLLNPRAQRQLHPRAQRQVSPCYSSKSAISVKNMDFELLKKNSEIKAVRLKVNGKYSRQNKQNQNDNNRSLLYEQTKKQNQMKEKTRNLTPNMSKNISERKLKKVQALTQKGSQFTPLKKNEGGMTPKYQGKSGASSINSKLKQVLALTPRGQRSELKKKACYKSQINLNIK